MQNYVFFGLMCFEATCIFIGFGPRLYMADTGNRFDVFLIIITSVTLAYEDQLRRVAQGVRVARLIRFISNLQSNRMISAIFETVSLSIPQV